MRAVSKIIPALALAVSFCPSLLTASMALPMDLPAMSRQAGKIFVGKCLESAVELDEHGIPSTQVRFEVLQGIKGAVAGEKVLIKLYGADRPPLHVEEGERAVVPMRSLSAAKGFYLPGEELLLFLYPESVLGFTSPVGAGQGEFRIVTDPEGNESVVNPFQNRFLKGMSVPAGGGPVGMETLIRRVEKLVSHGP